ncbi:kinase-like protein [Xylaria cf. heliscus]|nr:kinase-like protein [Xylaria cf. heliscus]
MVSLSQLLSTGWSSVRPAPSNYDSTSQSLYSQLNSKVIKPDNKKMVNHLSTFSFLPLDGIDETITGDVIKAGLSCCDSIFRPTLPLQIMERAQKVFTILGLFKEEAIIRDLFDEGLLDKDLPLARMQAAGDSNNRNVLISRQGKVFKSFSAPGKEMVVDNFLQKQWLVLAPVFSMAGEHLHVDQEAPLPFYNIEKIPTISINNVYKALLHPAHLAKDPVQVAIKDYDIKEDFDKERDNLTAIQYLNNSHVIRHIATVQHGELFYVVFPWADGGNLSNFWKRDPDALQTRHSSLFIWSFQQMLGLVDGLFALHRLNCRHGDLKPENILHFWAPDHSAIPQSQYGTLVIADVGVSRVHQQATELRRDPTNTKATTPCYEAPEAELNRTAPRGRRYDMWSIGCIFMEFTIWLLYGDSAISDFRRLRSGAAYYELTATSTAVIHPAVSRALEALRNDPRCGEDTGLADLIRLIADDLIVIDVEKRAEAGELRETFGKIVERGEKNADYLVRGTDPPSKIPDAFIFGRNGGGNG